MCIKARKRRFLANMINMPSLVSMFASAAMRNFTNRMINLILGAAGQVLTMKYQVLLNEFLMLTADGLRLFVITARGIWGMFLRARNILTKIRGIALILFH